MQSFLAGLVGLIAAVGVAEAQQSSKTLPIVNLGYERHQAILYNSTSQTFNFSNIRFAQPPLGDLRFRAPVPAWESGNSTSVTGNSSIVNDGSVGRICPQAATGWSAISAAFIPKYLTGQPFNETAFLQQQMANGSSSSMAPPVDPRQSEDCLFLDVVVPQGIFEGNTSKGGAPVLVWIYGGGYAVGEKTGGGTYQPYGLFDRAQATTGEKFVYVALNYRLGAFGFQAGPSLQSDGTANAGFYDQRTALEWVQKYIHLFGGDKDRVTVMGESAGAGSIMHQITAFNGDKPAPFQQAIPQSPAWFPTPGSYQQEVVFQSFLKYANVTSLQELRGLTTEQLQLANAAQIFQSPYGTFTYSPVVDGIFTPQLPGRALLSGSFDKKVRLMVGHNGDEALLFTQPNITTDEAYRSFIQTSFVGISPAIVEVIADQLYPPIYNGSYGYTDGFTRTVATVADSVFTCNTYYLAKGFGNKTFNYEFNVPPALHGQDISYTFATNSSNLPDMNVATALQEYITTFVATGTPNSKMPLSGVPNFPMYGVNSTLTVLNANITYMKDALAGTRCDFWQKALYY